MNRLEYPEGATPIDPDEARGLILTHHGEDKCGVPIANIRICHDDTRDSCLNVQVVIESNMPWLLHNLGGEISCSPEA